MRLYVVRDENDKRVAVEQILSRKDALRAAALLQGQRLQGRTCTSGEDSQGWRCSSRTTSICLVGSYVIFIFALTDYTVQARRRAEKEPHLILLAMARL